MVVVVLLGSDNLPGIVHIPQQTVLIEAGIPEAGIEALHKGILSGLAGLDKMQCE